MSAADASQAAHTIGGMRSDAGITITTTINPAHAAIAGHGWSPDAPIATRLVPNAPATTSSASGRLRSIARAMPASRRASTARSTPGRPGRPSSRSANLAASTTRTGNEINARRGPSTTNTRPNVFSARPRTSPAAISAIHPRVQAPMQASRTPPADDTTDPSAPADASCPVAMKCRRTWDRVAAAATSTTEDPAPAQTNARCSRVKPASSIPRKAVHAIPAAPSQIRVTADGAATATTAEHSPAVRTRPPLAPPCSQGPSVMTPRQAAETTSQNDATRSIPTIRYASAAAASSAAETTRAVSGPSSCHRP